MLRKGYNEEIEKLDMLEKARKLLSKKDDENLEKFKGLWEESQEYQDLLQEQEEIREVESFLSEQIAVFERETQLEIVRKTKDIFYSRNLVNDSLFEIEHEVRNYYYDKYRDDKKIVGLYHKCCSKYDRIFDKKHFEELVKYYDEDKLIPLVREAKYSFQILDKEHEEDREQNEYKITIVCDNGLSFDIFHNVNTYSYENVKLYTRDFDFDYEFIGTHIEEADIYFNLLKMAKNLYTGKENKLYKLYLKENPKRS